ncbi:MAG: fibrillarin-like rRNA/tRNA 2'-O-methyltransferase [Thermoplasmata archaeon]|nr:MAG: fibrillarin-like rRNA/tRNA 2'-O-methyltransferase [Thermoplasmata archaeon]
MRQWKFPGVFTDGKRLLTRNLAPHHRVYGEELVSEEGGEFRVWNPKRSKTCAMLRKGVKFFPVKEDFRILYLGAASGTTASHLSDIAKNGTVFCVEFSKKAFFDLMDVCDKRRNMIPIFADATKPAAYKAVVGAVDLLYQDISQRDQVGIFLSNMGHFLPEGGFGILMVKARSIDVTARPKDIFKRAADELAGAGLSILENIPLRPFEKDHAAIIVKKITP